MTISNCLNCEKELTDKFCSGCGQKADTHRISMKNFLFHDVLHGTFHIEKGMLFTAKQALLRPGQAALDYISGKRKRYYNVFYFILIVVGINILLGHFHSQMEISLGREVAPDPPFLNEASKKLNKVLDQSKIIIGLFVPFAALTSWILFRRKKLNLTEHCILSGMILLGISLISLVGSTIFIFDLVIEFGETFHSIYGNTVMGLILLHIVRGYYNAFGKDYSKWGITYRMILFFALLCLEAWILLLILIGFFTNWEFYTVNIVSLF